MPHQQLVEIACAIGANARIVIMDEPTASLTQREQHLLFEVVRNFVVKASVSSTFPIGWTKSLPWLTASPSCETGSMSARVVLPTFTEQGLIRLMVGRELSSEQQTSLTDQSSPASTIEKSDATQRETALSSALSLRNVSCVDSGVWDASLELRAGEILGLAGLVGAGRTELAQTIFGLTPADAGEILVDGNPVILDSPKTAVAHGIAYVPEDRTKHGIILGLPSNKTLRWRFIAKFFPAVGSGRAQNASTRRSTFALWISALRTGSPRLLPVRRQSAKSRRRALARY
jgi:rhamnose transport system ATP-binding protein